VEDLSSHPRDKRNVGVQFWEATSAVLHWQSGNELLLPAGHVPNNVIVKISQLPSAGPVSTADLHPQETQGMIAGIRNLALVHLPLGV
jgi:hypothetical protein